MKTVIQRVSEASVTIDTKIHSFIKHGFLILVGIGEEDSDEDIEWLVQKICSLRVFDDENQIMNLSIKDIDGHILAVSQFTLMARVKKGNRPSYVDAAKPDISIPLYEKFVDRLSLELNKPVQTGVFGADMKVSLINDGPVTILIDSKNKY